MGVKVTLHLKLLVTTAVRINKCCLIGCDSVQSDQKLIGVSEEPIASIFKVEGRNGFIRTIVTFLHVCMASQAKINVILEPLFTYVSAIL